MAFAHPLSTLPVEAAQSFPGQQEGERILYMIRPHWSREVAFAMKALLVAVVSCVALGYLTHAEFIRLSDDALIRAYVAVVLLSGVAMLWMRQFCEQSRAYITDRRFVRFEGAVPQWQSQRSLFWSDVVKTRTLAPSFLLKMLNVGSVEVLPNFAVEGQNILVTHAYMFGDLGAYLDKVVFTFRNSPGEMTNIRAFVPKPKGQRY